MKINTDGVLLGALAEADDPATILDIGTGTGVIALMLAQKYTGANVEAVEIDETAALTAAQNFEASPFARRLSVHAVGFEDHFLHHPERKYELIVSNPPFYIGSLISPGAKKTLAKHTDVDFFKRSVNAVAGHLSPTGLCWLILPLPIAELVIAMAAAHHLHPQITINIRSYAHSLAHRVVLCLGFDAVPAKSHDLIIYDAESVYSAAYKKLLQPYFFHF